MALAPCLVGYGAIAKRLYAEKETLREGNRYWKWIENYVAEDYTEAVQLGSGKGCPFGPHLLYLLALFVVLIEPVITDANAVLELLETHMRKVSPSRVEELVQIFIKATNLECSFWDMGLGHQV